MSAIDELFGSDDLPLARQIQRDDFAGDEFDADKFLSQFHKFQSLEDILKQLKGWDRVLSSELIDVINEDYGDFVGLGKSLSGGEAKVQDIKMDILRFQAEAQKVQGQLDTTAATADEHLADSTKLALLEDKARVLLLYVQKLEDIEQRLLDRSRSLTSNDSIWELKHLCTSYLSLLAIAQQTDLDDSALQRPSILAECKPRVTKAKAATLAQLDATIAALKKEASSNWQEQVLDLALLKGAVIKP